MYYKISNEFGTWVENTFGKETILDNLTGKFYHLSGTAIPLTTPEETTMYLYTKSVHEWRKAHSLHVQSELLHSTQHGKELTYKPYEELDDQDLLDLANIVTTAYIFTNSNQQLINL